jgi:sporulation protein YlmC with PRC-barrel domain
LPRKAIELFVTGGATVIDQSQLSAIEGCTVYGRDGEKIGRTGQVYLDDQTGRPDWVTVNTGLFGTNESFLPLLGATYSDDRLEVPYDKAMIKDAPRVDAEHHLDESEEAELCRYYGLP